MAVNEARLNAFVEKMIQELGAAFTAPLVLIGDKLGLYKAMAGAGPLSSAELAARTETSERYVREWLHAQAASGYVDYDIESGRFTLPDEQALVFADENSPVFLPGSFQIISAIFRDEPKISEAFRTGDGVDYHGRDACLFHGMERFFRTTYDHFLISTWLPALEGMEEKLKRGAVVADIGCGHGRSTILMAQAYPNSTFIGFDYHPDSVASACRRAEEAGVGDRVTFAVASAKDYPGRGYDLATSFDALHDMGDPVGAAAHVLKTLDADGTWMIVEPMAGDSLAENLNPIGRMYYAASTMICTPVSVAQEVGLALGAQAGEKRLRDVVMQGGFTRFRRAAETPFNIVLEARP